MKKETNHIVSLIFIMGIATGYLTSCTSQSQTPNSNGTAADSSIVNTSSTTEEEDDDIDTNMDEGKRSNRGKNVSPDAFKMF
ncbi:MAG: hypothetical protein IKP37_10090 [Paludibacteraceae bacterium]|nr:hypothetical protein [Paludibacteraceae bacterium]